ncbi:MAG: hypothetical protein LBR51_03675 [Bacteroidales bacterium]|nr:hypothetical protein [Bacteroidales bacterium]
MAGRARHDGITSGQAGQTSHDGIISGQAGQASHDGIIRGQTIHEGQALRRTGKISRPKHERSRVFRAVKRDS